MASTGTKRAEKRADKRIASWELSRIAQATGGELVDAAAAQVCPTAVSTDTRAIGPGELFVALRGENFDAHDFIDQAEEAGAVAAIVERTAGLDTELALIVVDDTLAALTALGRAIWREATAEGLHTINVTGSNGKTTVKEMLASLWQAQGEVFATPGNLNNHIGVPLVLCAIPEGCEHLVLELGANAAGEISHLVALAPGTERIITSIGVAHVEGFGSVDGIRRAKSEIFEGADARTTAIVPHAERDNLIAADFPGAVITVGFEADADLRVEQLQQQAVDSGERDGGRGGQRVRITRGDEAWEVELSLPGAHHGLNAAVSLATLLAGGLSPTSEECSARLSTLSLPQGRWREVEVDGLRFVDDAYNANPSSVKASFDAFMQTPDTAQRARIAVIGEMLELGDAAERWHREVAEALAANAELDGFVAVGPYARRMADAAREHAGGALVAAAFDSVEAVADWLSDRGSAFVFLKASRGARLERVVDLLEQKAEKHRAENAPND